MVVREDMITEYETNVGWGGGGGVCMIYRVWRGGGVCMIYRVCRI